MTPELEKVCLSLIEQTKKAIQQICSSTLLTQRQVLEILNININKLQQLRRKGKLETVRLGTGMKAGIRITAESVARYVENELRLEKERAAREVYPRPGIAGKVA